MRKQQSGFTLIELIIVIVILGILAVTAAPKFLDISTDAKGATVKAVVGAVKSVNTIVNAKALIAGATASAGKVMVNGELKNVVFGYLADSEDLTELLDIGTDMGAAFESGLSGTGAAGVPADGTSVISFYSYDDADFDYSSFDNTGCLILYKEAEDADTPATVQSSTGGCS
jgi:MSHA pilin protein MshA